MPTTGEPHREECQIEGCRLPWLTISDRGLTVASRHHGETHVNRLPAGEVIRLLLEYRAISPDEVVRLAGAYRLISGG